MKKILIVEDEAAYLKILHIQFTKKGYKVIDAANGKIGIEKIMSEKPDIMLLDIRMPDMDGMTMLELLRKSKHGKKMKVIILTNLEPDEKIISKIVVDQLSYYFIKSDIHFKDLLEKVDELLNSKGIKITT